MIEQSLQQAVADALKRLYGMEVAAGDVVLQTTKKEFTGDYTVVVFPYVKQARKSPEKVADELGAAVKESVAEVAEYNVIKGFLNFVVDDSYWTGFVADKAEDDSFGLKKVREGENPVVVEYRRPTPTSPCIWDIYATTCWVGR